MKIKIGTEVAHVTRDSDITFKVKRSKVAGGGDILWLPPAQLVTFARDIEQLLLLSASTTIDVVL